MDWKQDEDVLTTMDKLIKARQFRQKIKKKVAWNKSMNLLAFAVVVIVLAVAIWLFRSQISAIWNQFMIWRSQINITTNS